MDRISRGLFIYQTIPNQIFIADDRVSRKLILLQALLQSVGCAGSSNTITLGKAGDFHHADPYGHSMGISVKMVLRFNGMSKRVPKIKQHPLALVKFVLFNNRAFNIDAFINNLS